MLYQIQNTRRQLSILYLIKHTSVLNGLKNDPSYEFIGVSLISIVYKFQLAICLRRFQIAKGNLPIKIAILWDNISMLLAREHLL